MPRPSSVRDEGRGEGEAHPESTFDENGLEFSKGTEQTTLHLTAFVLASPRDQLARGQVDQWLMTRRELYSEHLIHLAEVDGVELRLFQPAADDEYRARVRHKGRRAVVLAPEPINRQRYLTGLHEFGHLYGELPRVGTTTRREPDGLGLCGEVAADVWAFTNAKVDPTPRDAVDVLNALYWEVGRIDRGGRRDYGPDLVPDSLRSWYRGAIQAFEDLMGGAGWTSPAPLAGRADF